MTTQILNSAFTADCENILRQLRDAIKETKLPYNSWKSIHAQDVEIKIEFLLISLMELTDSLRNAERAEADSTFWDLKTVTMLRPYGLYNDEGGLQREECERVLAALNRKCGKE